MSEFFSCNDSTGRYVFNIVFFSLIGAAIIVLLVLGAYLLFKRHKKAQKRRLLSRSRVNTMNTNSTILSGASGGGGSSQLTSNFILGRPPATDVILGVYGDEISKNARAAFYEEKGWRGFAYWRFIECVYGARSWQESRLILIERFSRFGWHLSWVLNS